MALTAKQVKFWMARLFGKRIHSTEQPTKTDKGCEITGYWFKKVLHITNMNEIKCQ